LHRRITTTVPPASVVMLGTSRVQDGLRGQAAEAVVSRALNRSVGVFNFGTPGTGPVRSLLTWQRLRRDGGRPDLLLIEVMPPQLSREDEQQDISEKGLPADRLSWSDLDLVQRYGGRPWLHAGWVASWLVPVYEHRFALVSRAAPALLPYWQRLP